MHSYNYWRDPFMPGNRGRAGLALSQDGKNWARFEATHHTAAILDAGEEGDWDEAFIGSPQVCSPKTFSNSGTVPL